MKVPLERLKNFVTIRLKPVVLAERLTMAGFEVTAASDTEPARVFFENGLRCWSSSNRAFLAIPRA